MALIQELARPETPRLTVYNKADLLTSGEDLPEGKDILLVSAATGEGLEELKARMGAKLTQDRRRMELLLPYDQGGLLEKLHRRGRVLAAEYEEGGVRVSADAPREMWERLAPFELTPDAPEEDAPGS